MAEGDLDGDGNLDLVVGNQGEETVSILRGLGDGSFAPQATVATTESLADVGLGDFNGDGKEDLVVIHESLSKGFVMLSMAEPTLTTSASAPISLGGTISDTAGPDDESCLSAPAFTSSAVPVSGNGEYPSPTFAPPAAGTYQWVAEYTGDSANEGVSGDCGDSGELVTVGKVATTTSLEAAPDPAVQGDAVTLIAKVAGFEPTGAVTFTDGGAALGTAQVGPTAPPPSPPRGSLSVPTP